MLARCRRKLSGQIGGRGTPRAVWRHWPPCAPSPACTRSPPTPATLAHQLAIAPTDALSVDDLLRAAKHLGLKAKRSSTTTQRLPLTPLPALALVRGESGALRPVIQCDGQRVLVQDPAAGGAPAILSLDAFAAQWTGELILLASRASLAGALATSLISHGSSPRWSNTASSWARCC